jgi:hypothetical protein
MSTMSPQHILSRKGSSHKKRPKSPSLPAISVLTANTLQSPSLGNFSRLFERIHIDPDDATSDSITQKTALEAQDVDLSLLSTKNQASTKLFSTPPPRPPKSSDWPRHGSVSSVSSISSESSGVVTVKPANLSLGKSLKKAAALVLLKPQIESRQPSEHDTTLVSTPVVETSPQMPATPVKVVKKKRAGEFTTPKISTSITLTPSGMPANSASPSIQIRTVATSHTRHRRMDSADIAQYQIQQQQNSPLTQQIFNISMPVMPHPPHFPNGSPHSSYSAYPQYSPHSLNSRGGPLPKHTTTPVTSLASSSSDQQGVSTAHVSPRDIPATLADPKSPSGSEHVHVFVDLSNITIGFYNSLKVKRGIPTQGRFPGGTPSFSFQRLMSLIERGRTVIRREAVGSVIEKSDIWRPSYMIEAENLGYKMHVLSRVPKSHRNVHNRYYSGSSTDGLPSPTPMSRAEQGVDELLHYKILEALADSDPGIMVLATGDAASAEYTDGFLAQAERALKRGWKVEVVSFAQNLSSSWRSAEWVGKWHEQFRVIELDPFLEDFLAAHQ